ARIVSVIDGISLANLVEDLLPAVVDVSRRVPAEVGRLLRPVRGGAVDGRHPPVGRGHVRELEEVGVLPVAAELGGRPFTVEGLVADGTLTGTAYQVDLAIGGESQDGPLVGGGIDMSVGVCGEGAVVPRGAQRHVRGAHVVGGIGLPGADLLTGNGGAVNSGGPFHALSR